MKKKSLSLADKILNYIRRNEREQAVPPGYKSILEWCKEFGCSRRRWGLVLTALLASKKIKQVKLRRFFKNRICIMNYYSIDKNVIREISKK
ncbi:MAG: hypothetical protein EBT84_11405 [Sphingomonadaceae bacterium]|nr:hypothetical protein [Sphingomonadaceae bacterium]